MNDNLVSYLLAYCDRFLNKDEEQCFNFFRTYLKKFSKSVDNDFGWIPERKISKEVYIENYQNNLADFIAQKRTEISQIDFFLEIGFNKYREMVAERIWDEHKNEIELNLCPKCNSLTRTPLAKQCKCGNSWR